MKQLNWTALLGLCAALASVEASAATIRVNCEVRGDRARISVDGKQLPAGKYSTAAVSGESMATTPATAAVGGEIEADYDSNPADIRAGATAIAATFVKGATVTGKVIDSSGNTVIADTVSCRVRSR